MIAAILVVMALFLGFIAYNSGRIARSLEWLAEQGAEECECDDCEESHA